MTVHGGDGQPSHYGGTERCASIWSCPVCSAVIRAERAAEIQTGVATHQATGGGVLFLTLTLRHRQGDDLPGLLAALSGAWARVQRSTPWRKRRKALGLLGTIKAVEITRGEQNGWHPHLHLLLLTEKPCDPAEFATLYGWLQSAWANAVVAEGGRMPSAERGVDLRAADGHGQTLARYLGKVQEKAVGDEVARGDLKSGRGGNRTPFELLDDVLAEDQALWVDYVRATRGRHAIQWSRGLREALGLEEERTDEQIVEEAERSDEVFAIEGERWDAIRREPGRLTAILDAVDLGEPERARACVDAARLGALLVDPATGEVLAEDPLIVEPEVPAWAGLPPLQRCGTGAERWARFAALEAEQEAGRAVAGL